MKMKHFLFAVWLAMIILLISLSFCLIRQQSTEGNKLFVVLVLTIYALCGILWGLFFGLLANKGEPMSIDYLSSGEKVQVLFECFHRGAHPTVNYYLIERKDGRFQFIKTGDKLKLGPAMVVLNNGSNILVALHENNQPF